MEISIISNKEEKLFNRSSIRFVLSYSGSTPSREEAKVELCKKASLRPDLTIITGIGQEFGTKQCTGSAHSYSAKADLDRFEHKYLLTRLVKKEKAPEEAKEEKAKPSEKPKEEKAEAKE
jgi:ribosomal protein S24E